MWSPDRRAVLLGLLAVSGLAACGLSPVYGPGGGGGAVRRGSSSSKSSLTWVFS